MFISSDFTSFVSLYSFLPSLLLSIGSIIYFLYCFAYIPYIFSLFFFPSLFILSISCSFCFFIFIYPLSVSLFSSFLYLCLFGPFLPSFIWFLRTFFFLHLILISVFPFVFIFTWNFVQTSRYFVLPSGHAAVSPNPGTTSYPNFSGSRIPGKYRCSNLPHLALNCSLNGQHVKNALHLSRNGSLFVQASVSHWLWKLLNVFTPDLTEWTEGQNIARSARVRIMKGRRWNSLGQSDESQHFQQSALQIRMCHSRNQCVQFHCRTKVIFLYSTDWLIGKELRAIRPWSVCNVIEIIWCLDDTVPVAGSAILWVNSRL